MQEGIKINVEDNKVYLSEEFLFKIKSLIKNYYCFRRDDVDVLGISGINHYDFKFIINSIAGHFNISSEVMLDENRYS